jgi:hypothetical protein
MTRLLSSVCSMNADARRRAVCGALAAVAVMCAAPAHAEEARIAAATPAPASRSEWRKRYDAAREDLVDGRFRRAEVALRALAVEAESASDRALALEMARLATEYAERAEAGGRAPPRPGRDIRTTDELTLLYASSFLYGVGTGTWFLLQVQPDSAITATLPFAALTAAPVIALATIDGYYKLPRGVPHSISSGLYLGLAQGAWLSAFQHARAERVKAESDPASDLRWSPESTATVLWASATTGAVLGGALGSSLVTTPGRVSFTASTALWSGTIVGLGTGAIHPDDERRSERAFLAGGVGLNAGIAAGLLFAGEVSPSVARVRLVDLLGVAGALTTTGVYLSLASDAEPRMAEGLAAAGAVAGLATGWLVTSGMPRESPSPTQARSAMPLTLQPSVRAVPGGATLGVGGTM